MLLLLKLWIRNKTFFFFPFPIKGLVLAEKTLGTSQVQFCGQLCAHLMPRSYSILPFDIWESKTIHWGFKRIITLWCPILVSLMRPRWRRTCKTSWHKSLAVPCLRSYKQQLQLWLLPINTCCPCIYTSEHSTRLHSH